MDINKDLTPVLEKLKNTQYSVNEVPSKLSDIDKSISKIIDSCIKANQYEQKRINKSITIEAAWWLLCFGIRMATYALRFSSQEYFTHGLYAIGMTLGVLDEREILLVLPLYCDVQKKNELSFENILQHNNEFSLMLKNFMNRSKEDKSIECMGYVLRIDENNNPTYQRAW